MGSIFDAHLTDLNAPKNKGGSRYKDDELTNLAHRAATIIWPMTANQLEDPVNISMTKKNPDGIYRNVYQQGGGSRSSDYIVKLTICGKPLRIFISMFRLRCVRYADAAILYFWKYRRTERQPEDSDFNTTLADAKTFVEIARPHLETLERFLIDSGTIQTGAALAAKEKVHNFLRDLTVARKYMERARRYTRILRERYALDQPKLDAIARADAALTSILDNEFSGVIQAGADAIAQQIKNDALNSPPPLDAIPGPPPKTEFDLICEQAAERARLARAEFNKTNQ